MSDENPDNEHPTSVEEEQEHVSRLAALAGLEDWLETPLKVLGFFWLGLLIWELTRGLSPLLTTVTTVIWVIFILDFALRMALAPSKRRYLKKNWLAAISLAVPALRVFRVASAARIIGATRATRGLRLVRVVGSMNRSMRALGRTAERRGVAYVVLLTLIVTFAGAAGMYAFEASVSDTPSAPRSYPTALWWTGMIMTTMGTEYWPKTVEGRVLAMLLSLYAFAVFGYMTAAIASYFIGRDAEEEDGELAGRDALQALQVEIAALRSEVRALRG